MRKILYILPDLLSLGGISRYNQNLLDVLLGEGYSVKVVSRNDRQDRYKNLFIYTAGKVNNLFLRKVFFSLKTFWQAVFFCPDLIICGHINFSPLCYMIQKLLQIKYVILTHGIEVWNISGKLKLKALKQSHMITSVSDFTKHKIIEQVPEARDKVQLLFNTVDGSLFCPKQKPAYLMRRYDLGEDDKVILTVARLNKAEQYKGYDKVLDVLPEILKLIPSAKYMIVGTGNDLENVRRLVERLDLEKSVILTGYVSDSELTDHYNLSDIFVMPSEGEGFGIVFLEAIACGKPVIAGNKDASKEPLLNGELGILVDPNNTKELGIAIIGVLRKEVPKRLLDSAYLRKKVLAKYGRDKFKDKTKTLIESL